MTARVIPFPAERTCPEGWVVYKIMTGGGFRWKCRPTNGFPGPWDGELCLTHSEACLTAQIHEMLEQQVVDKYIRDDWVMH